MAQQTRDPRELPEFCHQPLSNPSKHIRLLRISSTGSTYSDDIPDCQLTIARNDLAPSYIALSYTWGDILPRRHILLDHGLFAVRHNCWYAVRQLHRRFPRSLFWIDSVCINQADDGEKSLQVAMMGSIYSSAAFVVVSLGQHDTASLKLLQMVQNGSRSSAVALRPEPGDRPAAKSVLELWIEQLHESDMRTLCSAYWCFGQRPYWNRIWIIQELFLAGTAYILVGKDSIEIATLMTLHKCLVWGTLHGTVKQRLLPTTTERFTHGQMNTVLFQIHVRPAISHGLGQQTVTMLATNFKRSLCADTRDRVYGFLGICTWPKHLSPLIPNYTIPVAALALAVSRHVINEWELDTKRHKIQFYDLYERIADLLCALRIGAENFDDIRMPCKSPRTATSNPICEIPERWFQAEARAVCCKWLCKVGTEGLTAALIRIYAKATIASSDGTAKPVAATENYLRMGGESGKSDAVPLLADDSSHRVVGLACRDARAGDLLVKLNSDSATTPQIHLVLRSRPDSNVFEIVGQAFVEDGYQMCRGGAWCVCFEESVRRHPAMTSDIMFHFDDEDLLRLIAQGLGLDSDGRLRAGLRRPDISVTRYPFSSYGKRDQWTWLDSAQGLGESRLSKWF